MSTPAAHFAVDSRFTPADAYATLGDDERQLSQRPAVAVAVAPVLVLLALTLVIGDVLEPLTGLTGVLASVAWLVFEMHRYQRAIADSDAQQQEDLASAQPSAW